MNKIFARSYNRYQIRSSHELNETHLKQLTDTFKKRTDFVHSTLGGRAAIQKIQIPGHGSLIIKHYNRGGLIRYFNKNIYVKWGKTRSRIEFDMIKMAEKYKINVPKPFMHAHQGRFLYKCWLVTKEIPRTKTLADFSIDSESQIINIMPELLEQVSTLIKNRIFHVDFHPGNIIIDPNKHIFLIDFDKARIFNGSQYRLMKKYINRWNRAVQKHKLPVILKDLMQSGLTAIFK